MKLGTACRMQLVLVGTKVKVLLPIGVSDEAESCMVGNNDRAEGEIVGCDGSDDEAAAIGCKDGTTAAERVGSRAGGGGDDEAIGGIGGNEIVVDIKVGT